MRFCKRSVRSMNWRTTTGIASGSRLRVAGVAWF
jgi:hypothetical protein